MCEAGGHFKKTLSSITGALIQLVFRLASGIAPLTWRYHIWSHDPQTLKRFFICLFLFKLLGLRGNLLMQELSFLVSVHLNTHTVMFFRNVIFYLKMIISSLLKSFLPLMWKQKHVSCQWGLIWAPRFGHVWRHCCRLSWICIRILLVRTDHRLW